MTRYGMPYILEDTTGRLTGSEFIDIHERLHFTIRRTAHDSCHTSYMIYNTSPAVFQSAIPRPLVALDFGANNALGTISFASLPIPMRKYLTKHVMGRYVHDFPFFFLAQSSSPQFKGAAISRLRWADVPVGAAHAAESGMERA
jgi:hypothetical protein